MVLLAIAAAPVIYLLFWFYFKDKFDKEPLSMLFLAFLGGCISIIPAIIIGGAWQYFGFTDEGNNVYLAFYAFIVVALTEEMSKYLFLRRIISKPYVNEPYDGILYSVMVSMGFAFVENLFYVFELGFGAGILRAFTAVPAHAIFGAIMGFFLGKAKFGKNPALNTTFALLAAIIMHGFYDYFLFIKNIPLIQLGAFCSLFIGIWLTRKAVKIHNNNSPYFHS